MTMKELKELKCREQKKVVVVEDGSDDFRTLCKCPTCDKGLNVFDRFDYCP